MSFRQVIVNEAKYFSVENEIIAFEDEKKVIKVPIEEVAIIIINNNKLTMTMNAINKCLENNVMIVTCDKRHLPNGLMMPFSGHYRQLEMVYKQLELKEVKRKNIWREIIKQKIRNQSRVLKLCDQLESSEKLLEIESEVLRNDSSNREAYAAKLFFESMYGSDFIRFKEDKINSNLNYGYSILASSIVREIVSFGLDPKFGVWHKSNSNSLNLAYDLIEPFRPIVDYYIFKNMEFLSEDLSPKNKKSLVALLNANVTVNNEVYRLQNSIELFCKRFMKIIDGTADNLVEIEITKVNFYDIQ